MLIGLLLAAQIVVSLALIGVVLLQRSEGGGLVSGGTSSLVSVRGAGDLLTRATWILGGIFFALALLLAILAGRGRSSASVVDRLKVNAVNPAELSKPAPQPASGTQLPAQGGAAPLQAPTPTINSPFGNLPATPGGQPSATAPAPAPAEPAKK